MDISYLHGRAVTDVLTGEDAFAHDGAEWAINLEGGGCILCFDSSHEPPVLTGLAFTSSSVTDGNATLYFGTDANPTGTMIVLRSEDYGIMDDLYSEGNIERPGFAQEDAGATLTAQEPDPRVADGPSEAWHEEQAQRKADEEANDDGA